MYILYLKIISNPTLCFETDTSEVISNVVVNKNWTLVIYNHKGKIIRGSFYVLLFYTPFGYYVFVIGFVCA